MFVTLVQFLLGPLLSMREGDNLVRKRERGRGRERGGGREGGRERKGGRERGGGRERREGEREGEKCESTCMENHYLCFYNKDTFIMRIFCHVPIGTSLYKVELK